MTFYEAALEVLRLSGEPMSAEMITANALSQDLLSHTGRLPEAIMLARLSAMARQESPQEIVVPAPGKFALRAWGLPHDIEAAGGGVVQDRISGPAMRQNERIPMPLKDQAEARDAERSGRWERIEADARSLGERRKRKPKEDETPLQALLALIVEVGGGPVDLQYIVDAVPRQEALPEAFPRDLDALRALVLADNQRGSELGIGPTFILEEDRINLVPLDRPSGSAPDPRPRRDQDRARQTVRKLGTEIRRMNPEAIEMVLRLLARRLGAENLKSTATHSSGILLFAGSMPFGAARIKIGVGFLPEGRDLVAEDVESFREGLGQQSALMGALVCGGKVSGGARAKAEEAAGAVVMPLGSAELAELCLQFGVGVRFEVEERPAVDMEVLKLLSRRQ